MFNTKNQITITPRCFGYLNCVYVMLYGACVSGIVGFYCMLI